MKLNKKIENQIISVAYKDADIITTIKIYTLIFFNKSAKKVYNNYRLTKNYLSKIKKDEQSINIKLPNYIESNKPSFWTDIYCLFTAKPILPIMYATVIIIAVLLSIYVKDSFYKPIPKNHYSVNEIKKADKQAKYALALIGNLINETNSKIKTEVITKQVAEPLAEGLNVINNILN